MKQLTIETDKTQDECSHEHVIECESINIAQDEVIYVKVCEDCGQEI